MRFETLSYVHHQDGNVTEGRATGAQVAEGLVARSVNDEQAGELQLAHVKLGRGEEKNKSEK